MKKDRGLKTAGIAFAPSHSIARTNFDYLELPGGRKVGEMGDGELCRTLQTLKIPGVSPENGRATNVNAYAAHIDRIQSEGARTAVNLWLAAGRAS